MKGTPITEEEFERLQKEGASIIFDYKATPEYGYLDGFGGYFESQNGAYPNIIVVASDEGYFIRAREDLVKSKDEIFVSFCENIPEGKQLPNFEDVFEVKEL